MIRLVLTALVVALLGLTAPAAHADTSRPTVTHPLPVPVLRVENRTNGGWKIRAVLREIERRTVVDVRKGRCRDRADEVCVVVREGNYTPAEQREIGDPGFEWVGLAVIYPEHREVYLNNRYRRLPRRHVTAHEFGHVLGLAHHDQPVGVLGTGTSRHFSPAEIFAVNRVYQK